LFQRFADAGDAPVTASNEMRIIAKKDDDFTRDLLRGTGTEPPSIVPSGGRRLPPGGLRGFAALQNTQ